MHIFIYFFHLLLSQFLYNSNIILKLLLIIIY
ncbi:putative membrane protein, partial [Clostridioides difficile CD127]